MRVVFTLVLIGISSVAFCQTRWAVTDGPWSDTNTWSDTQGGLPGATIPSSTSTVFTDGYSITVDQDITITNLAIRSTNRTSDPQLVYGGLFSEFIMTITSQLSGVNSAGLNGLAPTQSVIEDSPQLIFRFTRTSGGSAGCLQFWSYVAPLNTVEIVPSGGGTTRTNGSTGFLAISESLTVVSGTFRPGQNLADGGGDAIITVEPGATLLLNGASVTGDGTLGTRFSEITISGTVVIPNSFLNTNVFTMTSTGILNCSTANSNQTEGWWYQSNRPTSGTVNSNSTITFNADGNQNVFARTYGNLVLDGSGTKTVPNTGTMNITGMLSVTSTSVTLSTVLASGVNIAGDLDNDGNWSPVQVITFNGPTSSVLGGSQSTTFGGGIRVSKTSGGVLTITTPVTIASGTNAIQVLSAGTLNLGSVTTTLNSGNVSNLGTITSGSSGTLSVQSTSTFSGAGSTTLGNLTVGASGVATFENDVAFTGNIINSGALSFPSSADVTFSGGSAQSISGNAFSLYDMIVNKASSTLSNNTALTLLGALTMTNGTFSVNGSGSGSFILNSDTNGDARIGPMANGNISGNVTFRRYYENSFTGRWRNFSFPVTGVTVANVASFIPIANAFAYYTEATPGNFDQGWTIQNSGTLLNNRGYTAYMYTTGPVTMSFTGPLLKQTPATHNYNVTYTDDPAQLPSQDGWNFVPNPYTCPINWSSASGWTKTNVNASAAVWDEEANTYIYSGSTWNGILAQGQGFWAQTNAASPSLSSTEAVKVDNSNPTFYRKRNEIIPNNRLFVKLEDDIYHDVALIQFRDTSTPEFDGDFDAYKLKNPIFNLSTMTAEGENLAVNNLPRSVCTNSLRLNVTNIEPGAYRFAFDSLATFTNLDSLVLIDKFTSKSTLITEGAVYAFDVTSDATSFGADRFVLYFAFSDLAADKPEISLDNHKLISNFESGNQWLLNGQPLKGETGKFILPIQEGEYQVLATEGGCSLLSEAYTLNTIPRRIYPNPADGEFEVDLAGILEDSESASGFIYMYSLNGQLILKEKFFKNEVERKVQLNEVKTGEYVVNVTQGESKIVVKERLQVK